jgi:fucose 4-O-acetylase-like acetyltransferase
VIVVPYVIFSIVYPWYVGLLAGRHVGWDPLEPYYLTWFLPALLAWRLSVPLWQQLRHPLIVASAIWLIPGFFTMPSTLNASQVLSFLPFFVVGLTLRPKHFELLRRRGARIAGAVVLLVGALAAYVLATTTAPDWMHWQHSFSQLGVGAPVGLGFRLLALATAAVLTAAFLAVVPARRTWFSGLGSATMYAYLLHGFVILFLSYQAWYYRISGWQVLGVTVGCVALTVALTTGPVRSTFQWVVEPRLDWLFNKPASTKPRTDSADAENRTAKRFTE